jgi:hypothetical protein
MPASEKGFLNNLFNKTKDTLRQFNLQSPLQMEPIDLGAGTSSEGMLRNNTYCFYICSHCNESFRFVKKAEPPDVLPCPLCENPMPHMARTRVPEILHFNEPTQDPQTEPALAAIFESTDRYHPSFCNYAQDLYAKGSFEKSAAVARELHQRLLHESTQNGRKVLKTPLDIAGKAYRALARQAKSEGDLQAMKHWLSELKSIERATDHDLHSFG